MDDEELKKLLEDPRTPLVVVIGELGSLPEIRSSLEKFHENNNNYPVIIIDAMHDGNALDQLAEVSKAIAAKGQPLNMLVYAHGTLGTFSDHFTTLEKSKDTPTEKIFSTINTAMGDAAKYDVINFQCYGAAMTEDVQAIMPKGSIIRTLSPEVFPTIVGDAYEIAEYLSKTTAYKEISVDMNQLFQVYMEKLHSQVHKPLEYASPSIITSEGTHYLLDELRAFKDALNKASQDGTELEFLNNIKTSLPEQAFEVISAIRNVQKIEDLPYQYHGRSMLLAHEWDDPRHYELEPEHYALQQRLQEAVLWGNINKAKEAIEEGADVNATMVNTVDTIRVKYAGNSPTDIPDYLATPTYMPPLQVAAGFSDTKMLELLLENVDTQKQNDLLSYAIKHKNYDNVLYLMDKGYVISEEDHPKAIEMLLNVKGGGVNPDQSKVKKQAHLLTKFIEQGLDVNTEVDGDTLLGVVAQAGDYNFTEYLVKRTPAIVNKHPENANCPLDMALDKLKNINEDLKDKAGLEKTINILLAAGAKPEYEKKLYEKYLLDHPEAKVIVDNYKQTTIEGTDNKKDTITLEKERKSTLVISNLDVTDGDEIRLPKGAKIGDVSEIGENSIAFTLKDKKGEALAGQIILEGCNKDDFAKLCDGFKGAQHDKKGNNKGGYNIGEEQKHR